MDRVFYLLDQIEDVDLRMSFLKACLTESKPEEVQHILKNYVVYENRQFSKVWAEKNRFANLGDFSGQQECNRKLKKIKRFIGTLKTSDYAVDDENESIQNFDSEVTEREPTRFVDSFQERVLEFDRCCSTNIYEQLLTVQNSVNDFALLESLKSECLETHKLIKEHLKKAKDAGDLETLEMIRRIRKTKSFILNYLNDSISRLHTLSKLGRKKVPTYEETFGAEKTYSIEQCKMMAELIDLKNPTVSSLTDLVVALKAVIQNYSFIEIYPSVEHVITILDCSDITSALRETYYLSILDTLKRQKSRNLQKFQEASQTLLEDTSLKNGDIVLQNIKIQKQKTLVQRHKQEKKIFSKLISSLENEILIQDDSFFDYAQSLDYQIIDYCIHRQIPYYYLKKILDSRPDLVYLEKDGESIVTMILENYIESQKIQLRNHHHDYIPKEYYKNFYQLLMSHASRPFSLKVTETIQNLAEEFELYIRESGYTTEHKNEALSLFDELVHNPKKIISSTLSKEQVQDISNNLKEYTHYLSHAKGRAQFDLEYLDAIFEKISIHQDEFYHQYGEYPTPEVVCRDLNIAMYDYMNAVYVFSTVCFQDGYTSYSLLQDGKGSSLFRMNVFDLSAYIQDGDLLEKYLKENMHQQFSNSVSYKDFSAIPSITYQIKIFPNGSIGNLKIFPSVVRVQKRYESLKNYRDDSILKSYVSVYKKLMKSTDLPRSIFAMETAFKEFITKQVVSFCRYEDIPILLFGTKFVDEMDLMFIQSDLGPTFSKMKREHFRFYSNIFRSCLDKAHYTSRELDGGNYRLKLDRPSSYIDLFNQRMLLSYEKLLQNESYRNTCWEDADILVSNANDAICYVQDIEKPKVKKKSRNY